MFGNEGIVTWCCGEEVEVACNGNVLAVKERFVPSGGIGNEDVNASCCGYPWETCGMVVVSMVVSW